MLCQNYFNYNHHYNVVIKIDFTIDRKVFLNGGNIISYIIQFVIKNAFESSVNFANSASLRSI